MEEIVLRLKVPTIRITQRDVIFMIWGANIGIWVLMLIREIVK